jgi:hypothetical protein
MVCGRAAGTSLSDTLIHTSRAPANDVNFEWGITRKRDMSKRSRVVDAAETQSWDTEDADRRLPQP